MERKAKIVYIIIMLAAAGVIIYTNTKSVRKNIEELHQLTNVKDKDFNYPQVVTVDENSLATTEQNDPVSFVLENEPTFYEVADWKPEPEKANEYTMIFLSIVIVMIIIWLLINHFRIKKLRKTEVALRKKIDELKATIPEDYRKLSPKGKIELQTEYIDAPLETYSDAFFKWVAKNTLMLYESGELPQDAVENISHALRDGYIQNLSDYHIYLKYEKKAAENNNILRKAADFIDKYLVVDRMEEEYKNFEEIKETRECKKAIEDLEFEQENIEPEDAFKEEDKDYYVPLSSIIEPEDSYENDITDMDNQVTSDPTVLVLKTYRLPETLIQTVERIAYWHRLKIQDVVAEALLAYIATVPKDDIKPIPSK